VSVDGGPVITAAHCIVSEEALPALVLVDPSNLCVKEAWSAPWRQVETIVVRDAANDIAVLSEKGAATISGNEWETSLAEMLFDPPIGAELLAVGWGSVSPEGPRKCEARTERQTVVAAEECEEAGLRVGSKICVRDSRENGTGACQGFSGGPVFGSVEGRWALVGLSSTGVGCGADSLGTVAPLFN
jgi:secreted trypsin-like serine protease